MFPSAIFAVVSVLSSLVAVNGGLVRRQGTFTFLTPQPTTTYPTTTTATTSPTTTSSTVTYPTTTPSSTISSTTSSTVTYPSTTPSTTSSTTSSTVTYPTTTQSTTSPTTSSTVTYPTTTPSPTSPTVTYPTATSVTVPITIQTTTTPAPPPVTRTTLSPSPTATGVNCNGIQQWQSAFAYTAGNQVIYNGQLFTARQWTYNNAPLAHPDQWAAAGTCAQPINNQANCNGVTAWQSTVPYSAGNQVTFNNHLWSAVQWTQSNSPGDTSGVWKDLGACA